MEEIKGVRGELRNYESQMLGGEFVMIAFA